MKCPKCGKEISIKAEIAAELAKAKKTDRLTNEEKAKNKAYYFKVELDSHKKRVIKTKLMEKDFDAMVPEKAELLKGQQVFSCTQEYLAPADAERAKKGLNTELVSAVRTWMEVNGNKIHTNATAAEIKEILKKSTARKAASKPASKAAPKPAVKPAQKQPNSGNKPPNSTPSYQHVSTV
ncbi:hypothetical protein LQZ21_13535 [Treponema sp. TIM-1]|uniref:hypothetical protein n=1 Tax=Treponema sp. TIM-1 TaxID=2898417 RepID=UPI00397FEEE7